MSEQYTKARFWKCALQVNPASYIAYRGDNHEMTEEQYNQALLQTAKENDIKVIGVANHGSVDEVDAIRTLMNANGIIVFPGFEIASSEKAHFVCLFPEDTTTTKLDRYLGSLELLDPEDGVRPSRLSAEQLLKKVEEDFNGFAYAAHCVDDNGVLSRKLNHVWQNPLLKAAQIPGTLDDLRNETGNSYRQILLNKTPEHRRELPAAIINAKDVATPQDLGNPKASCLIKMTNPGFDSFKLAFQDPESRVRLNSDVTEKYYSRIESLQVMGGYLDGLSIEFSEHLNAVIGGRGTGKSTLLECIRYALELEPIGKNALKQHNEIIKENLGRSKARIELKIRSSKMNGKRFTIARRYGESASVKDEIGTISPFTPADLLPEIELYGQNEITDINCLDEARLQNYLKDIIADPEVPQTPTEWESRLLALGFLSEAGDNVCCSIAGLVLFGKNPRRYLKQSGLRVFAFGGEDKEYQALLDEIIDGPLVGRWDVTDSGKSLIDRGIIERFIEQVTPFVSEEASKINEHFRRETQWYYPIEAVREVLLNALAHRDWTRFVDIEIGIYSNKLEVISPGALPNSMSIEKMIAGQRSPRNAIIMEVLRDYGYVDARGMGIRTKVVPLMKRMNRVEPLFEATEDYLKTVLLRRQ